MTPEEQLIEFFTNKKTNKMVRETKVSAEEILRGYLNFMKSIGDNEQSKKLRKELICTHRKNIIKKLLEENE